MLQSTEPPWCLQLDVLIAQAWLLRQTKDDFPEHEAQPSLFQYKFWSVPFWNSSTYIDITTETDVTDFSFCVTWPFS